MKKASIEMAYPLRWPPGKPRTPSGQREVAKFKLRLSAARDDLLEELRRLGARYVVLSSNLRVRRDGLPLAKQRQPEDPAVAVYFNLDADQFVFACDVWTLVEDNVRAIGLTIGALRGIKRWGSSDLLKQAFSGFQQLPAAGVDWRSVLDLHHPGVGVDDARDAYRRLARAAHPDHGGNPHEMMRLNEAMDAAKKELGS